MENLQKYVRNFTDELKSGASSVIENPYSFSGKGGGGGTAGGAVSSSSDTSRVLIARPPGQVVSLWTCSKLCAVFFVAGVVVGYTLKKNVRRWASKLLKRLKDD